MEGVYGQAQGTLVRVTETHLIVDMGLVTDQVDGHEDGQDDAGMTTR